MAVSTVSVAIAVIAKPLIFPFDVPDSVLCKTITCSLVAFFLVGLVWVKIEYEMFV